jgi:hypothetical protein
MEKSKFFYIGGGVLVAGIIIGARLVYINNYTKKVAEQNFTPEVMNEITNGNPESLDAPINESSQDEIMQSWENLSDLQKFEVESGMGDY